MKNPIATTIAAKIAPPMKLATLNALPPSVSAFEIDCVVLFEEVLDDGVVGDGVLLVSDVSVVTGVEDVTSDVLTVVVNVEFDADEGLIVVDEEFVVLVVEVEAVEVFVDFTGILLGIVTFSLTASSSSKWQKSSWQKQNKVDLFNELKGPEHPVLFSVAHPRS